MPKVRTTVTLDEEVLRAGKLRAPRTGKRDSEVLEGALRSQLAIDLFAMMDPDQAVELALEAQREAREELREER